MLFPLLIALITKETENVFQLYIAQISHCCYYYMFCVNVACDL